MLTLEQFDIDGQEQPEVNKSLAIRILTTYHTKVIVKIERDEHNDKWWITLTEGGIPVANAPAVEQFDIEGSGQPEVNAKLATRILTTYHTDKIIKIERDEQNNKWLITYVENP